MKTQIRLNSVVAHGVSGPEAGAINLIYEVLLYKYGQFAYSYISINQIGNDLDEVMIKDGKNIYINIRYPAPEDFESKKDDEKNHIRLEVLHLGLLRIAAKDKKLDIQKLEAIKKEILENNFSFYFVYKSYLNTRNKDLIAKLIIHPEAGEFKYFLQIEDNGQLKCNLPIYRGGTSGYYIPDLFKLGKWKNDNTFILTGKKREVEIRVTIDQCKAEYVNLTSYEKAPFFEMFRSDITSEEKDKSKNDYEHSLPPAIAAIIKKNDN